jgi:hypothetical protein
LISRANARLWIIRVEHTKEGEQLRRIHELKLDRSDHPIFIFSLEGRSVELLPNQGFVVPKGVMHCTRAPEKSIILMVETAAIVPTGDT